MEFWVEKRPLKGSKCCGDMHFIKEFGKGHKLVAVIDGLGHGVWAEETARSVCECLESNYHLDLPEIFKQCDQFLKRTVGVAMGVALIDLQSQRLTYACVGNIEARIVVNHTQRCLPCDYGIVGGGLKRVREESHSFRPANLLIMHSDGISAKFDVFSYPEKVRQDPRRLAEAIFRDFSRDYDDSIIVVGKFTTT